MEQWSRRRRGDGSAGWYWGKSSPVHLFWHSFDLATSRFSGGRAEPGPGVDLVTEPNGSLVQSGPMGTAIRTSDDGAVRRLTLCRPDQYNTITPQLRDELGAALDAAQTDRNVRVVLLDAEGPAFCAGYELAGATTAQARDSADERAWDSAADQHMIGAYAATWAKLHDSAKPTIASVSGWCIAGGTNIVFNAHLIVAGESARFGYPPSRVWGVPEAPWTWVARMGMQRARRYMLTGDEFSAAEAKDMGVVLDVVRDDELASHAMALAQRIALCRPTSSR